MRKIGESMGYISKKEPFMFLTIILTFICFSIATLVVISDKFYQNFIANSELGIKMGLVLLTVFVITYVRLFIEIKTNDDGTLRIELKNINKIVNK